MIFHLLKKLELIYIETIAASCSRVHENEKLNKSQEIVTRLLGKLNTTDKSFQTIQGTIPKISGSYD